ncbi:hypothetical protein AB1Y20_012176 [Prymnesium parvum]|uniref:tRNAHis guanylyltransferase catalytic domain-containing protein n=1 Tax=Prymnesium parvum TaxID=97485 RepID=A0AB34IQ62_PRYPA
MKASEAATCDAAIDLARPCVIRLDGHCFSTYTRGFARPYDERIHRAMVSTAADLLEHFNAVTAYTESDEISLFYPSAQGASVSVPFNGRVQKLVSVTSGYASARFNMHMLAQTFDLQDTHDAALRARVERCDAHFDSRAFSLPDAEGVAKYMLWRAVHDCQRNSISMLAQAHFPPARLLRVSSQSMLQMLCDEAGVDWNDCPAFFKWGTYIKKEEFNKPAINQKTQQQVVARRTRVSARSFEFKKESACFLLEKFWRHEGLRPPEPMALGA